MISINEHLIKLDNYLYCLYICYFFDKIFVTDVETLITIENIFDISYININKY